MTIKSLFPASRPSLDLNFAKTKRLDPRITFSRSSTATYIDSDGLIKSAAVNEARFDHNPATGESLGLLVEETRTNSQPNSFLFSNASTDWDRLGSYVIANSFLAPDNTFTASKLVEDTTNAIHYIRSDTFTALPNQAYTLTLYAKAAERSILRVGIYDRANVYTSAYFDLNTLGVTSVAFNASVLSTSITPAANGFYKLTTTVTSAVWDATTEFMVALRTTTAPDGNSSFVNSIYQGDGVSGAYIWGAQLEAGSFPTSYIPTPATFTGRTSTATFYDSAGVVQTAASGVARSAAFFPDSSGVMRPAGLLLEAAGTNLTLQSEDATGKTNQSAGTATVTINNQAAPDGNTTADTISFSSDISNGRFQVPFSATAGTTYTASFWIKLLSGSASFDMWDANGTARQTFTATSSWTRFSMTFVAASTSASYFVRFIQAVNTVASSYAVWGHQIETGSYPTSYIPTAGSTVTRSADTSTSATVTRSADVAQMTGTNFSSWYNQSSGTIYADYQWTTLNKNVIATAVGTNANGNNGFLRGYASTTVSIPRVKQAIGLTNFSVGNTATPANQQSAINGNIGGQGANIFDSLYPVYVNIGSQTGGNSHLNGTISRLTYWPTRLSDATLQALTAS